MADISKINIKNEQYDIKDNIARTHIASTSNPHGVTAEQVGARPDTWMPTAEQVGAVTPAELNAAIRKAAPRNLLDNSDFRNPVNQRGQTTYTNNGYTIDRWELYSGLIGVSSDGYVSTNGQMYQKIEIATDKVYTFAVKTAAGIAAVTGIPANGAINPATIGNALIKLATIGEYVEVVIEPAEGFDFAGAYWAALYEGSYTADTLPEYKPKGYGAELAECQRYYQQFLNNAFLGWATVDADGINFQGMIPCGSMRINSPTILGGISAWTGLVSIGVSSVTVFNYQGNGMRINGCLASSTTAGSVIAIYAAETVAFSADL